MDLEAVRQLPGADARRELMRHPGVGPYTADLALIINARRPDTLFMDVYIREVLRQFYFGGARVPDEQLRAFARTKWGRYQGYAGLYLTSDTDAWAKSLGVTFRLRSAALSDPDTP
jgi:N-glycosylase/DNA lyase